MFEIGNSLREARLRQGADLADAERATKIRSKYLAALEDERFEVLPAQTYVKGFLRSYAEFLGLDGQVYVDEYNSRYFTDEEDAPLRPRRAHGPRTPAHRRFESNVVVLALAGIVAAAALVIIAWKRGDPEPPQVAGGMGANTTAAPPQRPAAQQWIRLRLTATRGDSRLFVHRGSATGKTLYEGTLERGRSMVFVGARVWINATKPENLTVRLNGRRVALPSSGGAPVVAVASPAGIAPASAA